MNGNFKKFNRQVEGKGDMDEERNDDAISSESNEKND